MKYWMGIDFLNKMKVVGFVSSKEIMNSFDRPRRISSSFILHLEMVKTKEFNQNCWGVVTYVTQKYVLLFLGFMV
jgi:hypothetical protein